MFKDWVKSWIRRTLIINAIATVFDAAHPAKPKPDPWFAGKDEIRALVASFIHMPDLERFVFVMLFIERYSVYECSLLLGVSAGRILESREHALLNLPTAMAA